MVKYSQRTLDSVFFALSDPTRRAILERLAGDGDLKVTELAGPFDMSLPAVSKHLRVLERAGLLVQEKDGRIRRCQLVAGPLQDASVWLAQYRRFWEQQFDALAEYLANVQAMEQPAEEGVSATSVRVAPDVSSRSSIDNKE